MIKLMRVTALRVLKPMHDNQNRKQDILLNTMMYRSLCCSRKATLWSPFLFSECRMKRSLIHLFRLSLFHKFPSECSCHVVYYPIFMKIPIIYYFLLWRNSQTTPPSPRPTGTFWILAGGWAVCMRVFGETLGGRCLSSPAAGRLRRYRWQTSRCPVVCQVCTVWGRVMWSWKTRPLISETRVCWQRKTRA